jgi:hypothetical protein
MALNSDFLGLEMDRLDGDLTPLLTLSLLNGTSDALAL